jgi:hypothetical protein
MVPVIFTRSGEPRCSAMAWRGPAGTARPASPGTEFSIAKSTYSVADELHKTTAEKLGSATCARPR